MAVTVYKDRDNSFSITLKKNGIDLTSSEMSDISKYEIKYRGKYYNSTSYPTAFAVTGSTVTINPQSFGLGKSSKVGDVTEFIIYTSNYPDGFVWGNFNLIVSLEAEI